MTISLEIQLGASDDGSWAQGPEDASFWREGVNPLDTGIHYFYQHKEWYGLEGQQVSGGMNMP